MNILGGIACIGVGAYLTIIQVKRFRSGDDDDLGFDYKLLGGGVGAILVGIALLAQ